MNFAIEKIAYEPSRLDTSYAPVRSLGSEQVELDRFDARLLQEVQKNNKMPTECLGDAVGLSGTAVQRRLKRLRERGVIESDVSIVNPRVFGQRLTMVVLVTLERDRADVVEHFKRTIRAKPEVMSCYYVTGDADFVLVLTVDDMERYQNFIRAFFHGNEEIKSFNTMVVIDRFKASFALPIDLTKFK